MLNLSKLSSGTYRLLVKDNLRSPASLYAPLIPCEFLLPFITSYKLLATLVMLLFLAGDFSLPSLFKLAESSLGLGPTFIPLSGTFLSNGRNFLIYETCTLVCNYE